MQHFRNLQFNNIYLFLIISGLSKTEIKQISGKDFIKGFYKIKEMLVLDFYALFLLPA